MTLKKPVKRNKTRAKIKRLTKKADKLYQLWLIREKPKSYVSGQPTEVIHHFVYKSQSNNLRYDFKNGTPLTHREHSRHHLSGDFSIHGDIQKKMGTKWYDDLQLRRRPICKLNVGYLEEVIKRLEKCLKEKQ